MNAAYTYFLASAGVAEKRWLAEVALTRGYQQVAAAANGLLDRVALATSGPALGTLLDESGIRLQYTRDRAAQAVRSAFNLVDGLTALTEFTEQQGRRVDTAIGDRRLALGLSTFPAIERVRGPGNGAEHLVVRRKRMGTITLDDLPREQREGWPAASFWNAQVAALYWCDSKRPLSEVIRLTELELGPQTFDFVGYFKFFAKHGYVEFVS